ncbi:coiled-coil domain-containing protein 18-like isoform X2 [Dreissena polymorpha]|nr:coiled-coil domain-containing protein 18-like isoform X2 [Dreissena polymorpha]
MAKSRGTDFKICMPEHELSIRRSRSVNTGKGEVNTSVVVDITERSSSRGNAVHKMSVKESAPPHLLMQNVRDIRKRLMETEKTLNKISKAEAKVENDDIDDLLSLTSLDSRRHTGLSGDFHHRDGAHVIEEDRESVRSELATLPDSSYAGFERVVPPSSTPNRPQLKSRLTGLLEMMETREDHEVPTERHRPPSVSSVPDEERSDGRAKVRFLKEANKKVLIQNQKLMNEVEKTSYDLQAARAKVRELSYELDEFRQTVPDLEDKILGLQAETDSQEKALREAEERFETCQREVLSTDRKLKQAQSDLEEVRTELYEERKLRRSLETQRDEAMQNFLEAQDTLGEYQRKTKDKLKKYEGTEDDLRDSLTHANREREELLDRVQYYQSKVKSQQEEIRQLQSEQEVDEDNKTSIEQQNNELRAQISKLSNKITRLEADSQLLESFQFENRQLRSENDLQQQQLARCQQEIEESRTMLTQLEQLAQQVQHSFNSRPTSRNNSFSGNDSGNFSLRNPSDMTQSSLQKSAANGTESSTASAKNILSDLRLKLAMKDAEIEKLKAGNQERQVQEQAGVIENLRTDLSNMIEKNQRSAEQAQELDSMVTRLGQEKDRLLAQVKELRKELSDRDSENSSFEIRITQRNSQLIELQEQLNEKSVELTKLENKVREKTRQVSSLEEQLEEKTSQSTHQTARVKQLEAEITAREEEAQALHRELRDKQGGADVQREERERVQKIHQEQCKDYQKQIDILQERVENKSSQALEWEKQTDILRREISDKSHRLHDTEQALARTEKDLEDKKEQTREMLRQLESQARDGTNQIRQLETALNLCKDEIKTYIGALEENKAQYDKEVRHREEKIKYLTRQNKVLGHQLEVKGQECEHLEKAETESQAMIEQSTARIHDLEEMQAKLQKQISSLERELLNGNAQWMSDQQSKDVQLKNACEDLERKTIQLRELSSKLKSVEEERNRLSSEVDLLDAQLHDEQDEHDSKSDRIAKLERDLRDMRVQLEHKIELVTDFEEQLTQKNGDMEQQLQLVGDLDHEIKRFQDLHEGNCERIADLEKQLDKAGYEAKARDEMIDDLKDSLRSIQEELSSSKSETVSLKALLEERQQQLEERVALVGHLESTLSKEHEEMERRIQKLDQNVQKHVVEVQERTKQIADLDDKLQQTQSQLREVTLQHQQGTQLCNKQQMELQSKTAKLQELETLVERQKTKLDEQKEENVEITQELRLTREQLQQQHTDFMSTRRELAHSNREQEKLQRELEELRNTLESYESDKARLAEELGAAKARVDEAQSKTSVEVQKLSDEHDDRERKYQSEVSALREEMGDYREANDILKAQLRDKTRQLGEMEKHYADQVRLAAQELDNINEEMESRKEQMENSSEQIILKDSEIARLQAKISGLERTLQAMRMSDSSLMSNIQGRESDILGMSRSHRQSDGQGREIILTDVTVSAPTQQYGTQAFEVEQEVEIRYIPRGRNNNSEKTDQENIEPTGPVRVLNFAEDDQSKTSGLHRPKPVLPKGVTSKKDRPVYGNSKESAGNKKEQKTSAFSRVIAEKPKPKEEPVFPGEIGQEPVTAMRMYSADTFDLETSDLDPEQCMKALQDKLRANEQRQKDIDRQLQNLDLDDDNEECGTADDT